MALGKTVKALREAHGWTLKDLSKRSGVPVGTIGALEVRDSVRSEYAPKLAIGFGIPLEELLPATATATLTAPTGTLSATGSATKQPLAQIEPAQGAINGVAQALEVLCQSLKQLEPSRRDYVIGSLTTLVRSPGDTFVRDQLTAVLGDSGFAETQLRAA